MVAIGIAVGVAAVAAFMLTGYLIGLAVSTPGEIRAPGGGAPSTCAEFCSAWQTSRSAVCNARTDLRAAQAGQVRSPLDNRDGDALGVERKGSIWGIAR
jgi:hypothetical protein